MIKDVPDESGEGSETVVYNNEEKIATEEYSEEGNVVNRTGNIPDGKVVQYFPNHDRIAVMEYKDNMRNGPSKVYSLDKTVVKAATNWKNDKLTGDAEYSIDRHDSLGRECGPSTLTRQFLDGKQIGAEKLITKAGVLLREDTYEDGVLIARKIFYATGELYSEEVFQGICNPLKKTIYYKNGNLMARSDNMSAKLRNGEVRDLATLMQTEDGKPNGVARMVDADSLLIREVTIKEGKPDGISKVYNGIKKKYLYLEQNYSNGKLNGVTKTFNNWGKLIQEETYMDNFLEGISTRYYLSGKVYEQKRYKHGELDGIEIKYSESGEVIYKSEGKVYNNLSKKPQ